MSEAARQLREFLDARDGHHEAPISQLVGPWDEASRARFAEQLTADLDAVGVNIDPPLAQCGPETVIRLRIADREEPPPAPAPPSSVPEPEPPPPAPQTAPPEPTPEPAAGPPEPEPAAAPNPAVARPRRLPAWRPPPVRPAIAGGAAVALLVVVLLVAGVFGGDDSDSESSGGERTAFCDSKAGAALTDAEIVALDTPARLRSATDSALQSAGSAPPGTDCAVFALNSLAEAWGKSADRVEAARQIRRIREFQRAQQLLRPRF